MKNNPLDGLGELTRPDLKFIPESQLWQAIAEVQLRNWQGAYEKFARTHNLLLTYPEPFYSKFSILAIEAALAADHDREASEWLAQLDMQAHAERINPGLSYLRGVLHSKAGRQQMAEELWKQVVASNDRLYQIRRAACADRLRRGDAIADAPRKPPTGLKPCVSRGAETILKSKSCIASGCFIWKRKNVKAALQCSGAKSSASIPTARKCPTFTKKCSTPSAAFSPTRRWPPYRRLTLLAMYQAYGDLSAGRRSADRRHP